MPYLSYAKGFQGVTDAFLRDPGLYTPLLQFIEAVMTRKSELMKTEREMIAAYVSHRNGCSFCYGAHRWTLAAMGVDWATIESLNDGAAGELLDERLRSMLRFAAKLTDGLEEIGQTDVDLLLAAGWTEQAVEDAVNVVALFNYVNRLVDGLGIKANDDYFRQVGKTLASKGYAPLIETALKRAS